MRDWMSSDFGNRMHEKVKWNLEKKLIRIDTVHTVGTYNMN